MLVINLTQLNIVLLVFFVISKVFEMLLNSKFVHFLESLSHFSDAHYGFRDFCSTADLLTVVTVQVYRFMDSSEEDRVTVYDVSKVFHRVRYSGLLHKL